MTATKKYFTREEAINDIIECLEGGYVGYYCDLHDEVFNTGYYIIGTYEAKEALKQYDVFKAIEKVKDYEELNLGEVTTDISDPEKLANMLYYIIGYDVISDMYEIEEFNDNWNYLATEATNAIIVAQLKEML